MADFTAFSETSQEFDPVQWVNIALRAVVDARGAAGDEAPAGAQGDEGSLSSVEDMVQQLVRKLQVTTQEVTTALDDSSSQALKNVPRTLRSIEWLATDANALKKSMAGILAKLSQVQENAEQGVSFLSELDAVKSRMEDCLSILAHARQISRYGNEIEDILAQNDFEEVAVRLQAMRESLDALSDVKEFDKYRSELHLLLGRLEDALRPQVIKAFKDHASGPVRQYLGIYSQIGKSSVMLDEYYACRREPLHETWHGFRPDGDALGQWLPSFYEEIVVMLNKEVGWCQPIFGPHAGSILENLVANTLQPLRASFVERLQGTPLQELLKLHGITETFAQQVQSVLAAGELGADLVNVIFAPYFAHQQDYARLESVELQREVEALQITGNAGILQTVRDIDNTVPRVYLLCENALQRCIALTGGRECEGLIKTLNQTWVSYIRVLMAALKDMQGVAVGDVDLQSISWDTFQGALRLFQATTQLSARLESLDSIVRESLTRCKAKLVGETALNPPLLYLAQEPDKAKRLVSLLRSLDETDISLLSEGKRELDAFAASCQMFVYDTMFVHIQNKLDGMGRLDAWRSEPEELPEGVELPTFSLSPLEYITQIGEHLLTLPQQLEPFVDAGPMAIRPEVFAKAGVKPPDQQLEFAAQWLSLVSEGTMSYYYDRILAIPYLTHEGGNQLATDVAYLFNILSALGIPPDPKLELLSGLLKVAPDGFDNFIVEHAVAPQFAERVARQRGLAGSSSEATQGAVAAASGSEEN